MWYQMARGNDKKLNLYECTGCKENDLSGTGVVTMAYDCPTCKGVVLGKPEGRHYDDIGCLSGSSGVNYHCKICDEVIGETQYRVS
jgi:predicted SprT family Zn-dependent metalloprotease